MYLTNSFTCIYTGTRHYNVQLHLYTGTHSGITMLWRQHLLTYSLHVFGYTHTVGHDNDPFLLPPFFPPDREDCSPACSGREAVLSRTEGKPPSYFSPSCAIITAYISTYTALILDKLQLHEICSGISTSNSLKCISIESKRSCPAHLRSTASIKKNIKKICKKWDKYTAKSTLHIYACRICKVR